MNEITSNAPPRFAGMENRREYEKVTTELELAKARHPKTVREFHVYSSTELFGEMKRKMQLVNSMNGGTHETGFTVLMEEVYEAFESCANDDWKNAYTEFAQVAAVAIRLMEKVRNEHLERKDGEE